METMRGSRRTADSSWFTLSATLVAAAAIMLAALSLTRRLDNLRLMAVGVALLAIGAGVALIRWWRVHRSLAADIEDEARARQAAQARLEERQREVAEAEAQRAGAEEEARARQEERDKERALRLRTEHILRAQREWNTKLRSEIYRLHDQRGVLGRTDDVRTMVLRIALNLLRAEKGMLFSRDDEDHDGKLDVVVSEGFSNDPSNGAVAQWFAKKVVQEDETIRVNDPSELGGKADDPVDDEIDNLVAIPIFMQDQFSGAVVCCNKEGGFDEYDDEVLLSLGDHAGAILHNAKLQGKLRDAYVSTVRVLSEAIQAKDPFLRGHSEEVSRYVSAVADRLSIDPKRKEELLFGSLLHDVGKIGISERILLKPGPLSTEERNLVQLHPRIGYRIIHQVPALEPIGLAVLHHHERYDGNGYPAGLRGEEIPIEARIISVADSFSAMTAERPYRPRMSLEEACAELERCAGTQFDPTVVRIFVEEVRKNPPEREADVVSEAMRDPELQGRRKDDEPVLGFGSYAITDNMTLLYSHRYFHEVARSEAERAAVQGTPFAVVLASLEEIDAINHSDGYAAGDDAIKRVAQAVQRVAIRCGGTACRHSGRRIGLIVPRADLHPAKKVAQEVVEELDGGPAVRVAADTWRPGDAGDDVIARARGALDMGTATLSTTAH
jgi:diguanylate cyclase (GGDEF)-like protein